MARSMDPSPADARLLSTAALGTIGVLGVAYFAATLVAMHAIRADLDPVDRTISEYALGAWGALMGLAWVVCGVAVLALALGLHRSLEPGRHARLAVWSMVFAGLAGFVVSGLFTTDVPGTTGTFVGGVHSTVGSIGLLAVPVGAFLLAGVFARDSTWTRLARPARWFAWGMAATLAARIAIAAASPAAYAGLGQRLLWLWMLAWLGVLGWQMRQVDQAARAARSSPSRRPARRSARRAGP